MWPDRIILAHRAKVAAALAGVQRQDAEFDAKVAADQVQSPRIATIPTNVLYRWFRASQKRFLLHVLRFTRRWSLARIYTRHTQRCRQLPLPYVTPESASQHRMIINLAMCGQ